MGKRAEQKADKKGFFSVYACLFLAVLLASAGLFIGSAKKGAGIGAARACTSIWSQSILAEYDQNLQSRYDIFGYYGYPALVEDKLAFYAEESFGEKKNLDLQISSCSLFEHSLRNTEVFARQIRAWGRLHPTGGQDCAPADIKSVTHHQKPGPQVLFSDLPSEGCKTGLSLSALRKNYGLKDLVRKGSDTSFQLAYIFSHFKDQSDQQVLEESCLHSEVEYIIGGRTTDDANENAVKGRIIALREVANLTFLENSPEKTAAIYAAAALISPEAAQAAVQTVTAVWAYAESINDYHLLTEGYPVPKVKTDESWATDLDAVLSEDGVDGCIYTGQKTGDTYQDYLRLLLLTMEESTRLLRIMDLIQISMRYCYYDTFLIEDYYGGISYTCNINGETCHVEETYE